MKRLITRSFKIVLVAATALLMAFTPSKKEEGIYPLAQLGSLDLSKAGLEIAQSDIYEPGKVGLTNALVRLGGCTGSFISEKGLIITNHHCVFGAVASASTPENNYLDNGFYAKNESEEIKTSLPCRITLSFDDVSDRVLEGVNASDAPEVQQATIEKNLEAVTKEEQAKHPELKIEISEMFVGKYYTLFRYKMLDDVRLVYVPPKAVGKFGGETDNWVWPRHNGDFSIVRAYENGKPYVPEKHLKIDVNGTKENDFVFILGYPGRTYRHAPAQFLTYQNDHLLPVISSWFDERIDLLKQDAKGDPAKQLRYASTLASLSNTTKNFKGKMQGFRRTNILEQRYSEQDKLEAYIVKTRHGLEYKDVIPRIRELYKEKNAMADDFILLNQMHSASGMFHTAHMRNVLNAEYMATDKANRKAWLEESGEIAANVKSRYRFISVEMDKKLFSSLLYRVYSTGNGRTDEVMKYLGLTNPSKKDVYEAISKIWESSKYAQRDKMTNLIDAKFSKFLQLKDPIQDIARMLAPHTEVMGDRWGKIETELNTLLPRLAELKQSFYGGTFVPDANSTLRLTYGYVKGYSPSDGVYNDPFTTLDGIIEKATTTGDYYMPENILEKYKTVHANDNLKHPEKGQVVVGVLYNLDTTGGNSGSPILNARGELVGVNFDRAFSATINDFEWNESYSRSIGVDIRYVLYVMKYVNHADAVLDELGIDL
ncbi:MAG: S46 family peptidase [Bacteroidia bacterium]|nr:S46 family peptidase [Bacteroidia bacterium]